MEESSGEEEEVKDVDCMGSGDSPGTSSVGSILDKSLNTDSSVEANIAFLSTIPAARYSFHFYTPFSKMEKSLL